MLKKNLIEENLIEENKNDVLITTEILSDNVSDVSSISSLSTEEEDNNSLSYTTRICGFLVCTTLGYFCSYMSTHFIGTLEINPYGFAILYSIGNILSLIGSLVLYGNPFKDFYLMFTRKHILPTLLFFISMGLTFYCAFTHHRKLVFLFISLQFASNIWSSYTYFPDKVKNWISSICCRCFE
jgi:hypothetical protein